MSIKIRIQLTVITVLFAGGIISLTVFITSRQMNASLARVNLYTELVRKIAALDVLREELYFDPRERSREQWQTTYNSLGVLLEAIQPEDAAEKFRVASLRQHHGELRQLFSQLLTARTNSIESSSLQQDVQERLASLFNVKFAVMFDQVSRLVEENQKKVVASQQTANWVALSVVLAMLMLSGSVLLLTSHRITQSFQKLREGTSLISRGNLNRRVEINGADEIADLGESFNAMAQHLELDIAERERVEDNLRASEARFHTLVEQAADAFFLHDTQGTILDVNRQACESLGYTREELIGMSPFVFDVDVDHSSTERLQARLAAGEVITFDTRHRRKDGTVFPVEVRISALWEGGRPVGFSLVRDVTERKRAEEALRNVLRHARTIVMHAEVTAPEDWDQHEPEWGAAHYHWESRFYDSEAAQEVLPLELPPGKDYQYGWGEAKHCDDLEPMSLIAARAFVAGASSWNQEFRAIDRYGRLHWFAQSASIKPAAYGRWRVTTINTDITERKRAEEELARHREHLEELVAERTQQLRHSEEHYRRLFETMLQGVVYQDANGKIIAMNPATERILGVTPADFLGQTSVDRESLTIREDGSRFPGLEHPAMMTLQTGRQVQDVVMGVYNPREKDYRWITISAVPIFRQGEDTPYQVYTLFDDITERKRADEEIRRLNRDLQDRAVALEAVNQELEAFAYSVSHDLRAPLRHIDGFLELFQKRTIATLDEKSQRYLANIADASKRMDTLIDDLLSFSQMGHNKMTILRVNLVSLVQDVIRELEPEMAGRNIHWRIANLPVVVGDRAMLRNVLFNLISNALKFTKPRRHAEIEIGYQPGKDAESVVFVRDNGVGFDPHYADKLFGVFQRLHRAEEFEGTGIGLANVRRIIQRHGGRTWAEGQVDRGATFYFSLPHTAQGG
ncbi:MAG: PAS domain S-box protein [Chloroflexi bacterium]|nr:PAS domain S-box protein [Chloroflexota bacterium]